MSNIQLANNLRFLRTKHKLTQDDLSSLLNISRQAYSNYETSKRTPDLDSLLHISRFYRISIDELVLDNLQSTYHTSALKTGEEYIPYVVMAKEKNTGNSIYLSREELDFIIKYRALSEENKQILAGFLQTNLNRRLFRHNESIMYCVHRFLDVFLIYQYSNSDFRSRDHININP